MKGSNTYAPKIQTGINVIDEGWGGLYRGGSYLLYGQAWSGRNLMTLQYTFTAAQQGERTLYIFPDRPRDLIIQAASINFDLRKATEEDLVKLMRIPPSFKPNEMSDEDLHKSLLDLAEVAKQEEPDRLVIESFNRFAQFNSLSSFRDAFVDMLEQLELVDTTLLFALGEPANENAKRVIESIATHVTGTIHIDIEGDNPYISERMVTIVPNIGHLEGAIADYWDISETILENEKVVLVPDPEPEPEPEPVVVPEPEPVATEEEQNEEKEAPVPSSFPVGLRPRVVRNLSAIRKEREQLMADEVKKDVAEASETLTQMEQETDAMLEEVSEFLGGDEVPTYEVLESNEVEETETIVETPRTEDEFSNRESFLNKLKIQFSLRDVEGHSFLLIAMRMNREEGHKVRPFDFEFILDLVSDSLRPTDSLLVNHEKEKLIVLRTDLDNGEDDKAFFKSFNDKIKKEAPHQADHLIKSVGFITVRNGKPFKTAEEFLTYAIDKA